MKERQTKILSHKRGYGIEGHTLLSSILRPCLFGIGIAIGVITIIGVGLESHRNDTSAVSATLSIPEAISVNVNPSVNSGFAESSNGSISVSTGNQNGYTLTIKAKDNNQLKNGSNVLSSITTNLIADQYKNGDYLNTWGFKPSVINSESNTSYVPGPTTSGITLVQTNTNSASAENYSLGIAAKVDSNTIAGNYQNTFILTALANEASYTINYDAASLSGATNAGAFVAQTGYINGDTQSINVAEPAKSGTDFLGWCDEEL